jgi:Calcineurin-like phosphoesterase
VPNFVIGDIHGCLENLQTLLKRLELIGDDLCWSGSNSSLWFLGDYMDRGPDGVGVLDFIMRLQLDAVSAGGFVGALLGNHDVIVQEVWHFGNLESPGWKRQGRSLGLRDMWLQNAGGRLEDLERLKTHHLEWLENLPVLAKVGNTLLMHADSTFYLQYGSSVNEVNANVRALLKERNLKRIDEFEERFATRREFLALDISEDIAAENLERVLTTFGAARLVHGHTPIYRILEQPAPDITEPYTYQHGRCTNVDACFYAGGPGFALRLEDH